jgi:hypothetical protein
MKIRGGDGSKIEPAVTGRLKGAEQRAVRGTTLDQKITNIERILRSKQN